MLDRTNPRESEATGRQVVPNRAEMARLQDDCAAARTSARYYRRKYREVMLSRSWRITAPIRLLKKIFVPGVR